MCSGDSVEPVLVRSTSTHGSDTPMNKLAFSATVHCLTGCAIGEVLGVAFAAAFPVNLYLITRGRGHAMLHQYHEGHHREHDEHN